MKRGFAVLSAIGPDRVGIVHDITKVVSTFSCNIEESRMIQMGGEFSVIMLIDGREDDIDKLSNNCSCWDDLADLHISLKKTSLQERKVEGLPYLIKTLSLNTPGIVHAVTTLIQAKGVSILELDSDTSAAPFTGSPMFSMRIEVIIPTVKLVDVLREELHEVGQELNIEIQLSPLTG